MTLRGHAITRLPIAQVCSPNPWLVSGGNDYVIRVKPKQRIGLE